MTINAKSREQVERARVARLGTHDVSGRLHLVPICFALDGDTLYSAVDAKPKRSRALRRLENVRANRDACVLVDHYEEDWSRLWWVRLRGRARVLEGGVEHERAASLLRAKYGQYEADPLDAPVLAIDLDEWRAWSSEGA
jgi:PPOX class probable F420-dependent enzyme